MRPYVPMRPRCSVEIYCSATVVRVCVRECIYICDRMYLCVRNALSRVIVLTVRSVCVFRIRIDPPRVVELVAELCLEGSARVFPQHSFTNAHISSPTRVFPPPAPPRCILFIRSPGGDQLRYSHFIVSVRPYVLI